MPPLMQLFAQSAAAAPVFLHLLHVITPVQTATLIVGYGLWTQGYGVWKLRRTLDWRSVAPFVIGGTIYLVALGVIHLLAPRMDRVELPEYA